MEKKHIKCVFIFWVCASLAMVPWYLSYERPFFPHGFQCQACFGVFVGDILRTWPKYIHLLSNIVVKMGEFVCFVCFYVLPGDEFVPFGV